ncbi:hypothetical protein PFISCL1PPCAC_11894, partial [Pristionchus fissidentatus]
MSNSEAVDAFYWNVARGLYGVQVGFVLCGICTNSIILITTITSKSLRSTCNLLIGLCAVADICHLSERLFQLPFLFKFNAALHSDTCRIIMIIPEMGVSVGAMCMMCVGIDRLFSIQSPTKYRAVDNRIYYPV